MLKKGPITISLLMIFACIILFSCDSDSSSSTSETATTRVYTCPMCNGSGKFEFMPGDLLAPVVDCSTCTGTGVVDAKTYNDALEMQSQMGSCSPKVGSGNQIQSQCPNCYGNGRCSACAGRGEKHYEGMYGHPGGVMDCPICRGTGRCQMCRGRGTI